MVEATLPMSQVESHHAWEPILLSSDYVFAYADGLNRFYVAKNRAAELLPAFKYPPNVFDTFTPNGLHQAEARVSDAESKAHQAATKAQQTESKLLQAELVIAELLNSLSWRITAPLRGLSTALRRFMQKLHSTKP